jgi:hypothetical protein
MGPSVVVMTATSFVFTDGFSGGLLVGVCSARLHEIKAKPAARLNAQISLDTFMTENYPLREKKSRRNSRLAHRMADEAAAVFAPGAENEKYGDHNRGE